jgi:hypothetical protein
MGLRRRDPGADGRQRPLCAAEPLRRACSPSLSPPLAGKG